MKIKEVWRDANGNLSLTKPKDPEGWERIPVKDLKPDEQVVVKLDELGESFDRQIADQQREIDELKAKLFQNGATETPKSKPMEFTRLFRAMNRMQKTGGSFTPEEEDLKRIVESPEARALGTTVDTGGGFIVPFNYMAEEFIGPLYHSLIKPTDCSDESPSVSSVERNVS